MDQPLPKLSELQQKILTYAQEYSSKHAGPPTIREICKALGISSTSQVYYHLKVLERLRYITRERGKSRGLIINHPASGVRVMGAIAAGVPLDLYTDREQERIELPGHATGRAYSSAYALIVRGNSMIEDSITDGDYVLIDPEALNPRDGDIVVAYHRISPTSEAGAATLKRLYREPGRIRLQPANSTMEPIYIDAQEWDAEWQVQGKVIGVYRPC